MPDGSCKEKCKSDKSCRRSYICHIDGTCQFPCSIHFDCLENEYCHIDEQICQTLCTSNTSCAEGYICEDGACYKPCKKTKDCLRNQNCNRYQLNQIKILCCMYKILNTDDNQKKKYLEMPLSLVFIKCVLVFCMY